MTAILVAEDNPGIRDLLAIIDVNMPEISRYELARQAANRNIPTLLSGGHSDTDAKLKEFGCPYLAKPYRAADLICKSAKAITQAAENIRRIRGSLAKLEATTEALIADFAESNGLISQSKAILAGPPPPEPVIPSDVVDEWLIRLSFRPRHG